MILLVVLIYWILQLILGLKHVYPWLINTVAQGFA